MVNAGGRRPLASQRASPFFAASIALSNSGSANGFFSFALSSSSAFNLLASDLRPPYFAFDL